MPLNINAHHRDGEETEEKKCTEERRNEEKEATKNTICSNIRTILRLVEVGGRGKC